MKLIPVHVKKIIKFMYINCEKFKKKLFKILYWKDVYCITSGEKDHTIEHQKHVLFLKRH